MLFNEVRPQKYELEPKDSGSSESDYQSAETNLESGSDSVSSAEEPSDGWWHMSFDGAASKKGVGTGIWIRTPIGEPKLLSYKLEFKCTNNVAEYEALIFGLKAPRDLQSQRINIQGDPELIIKQVQGGYQTKNQRLRLYRNLVLVLVEEFKECQYTIITREENSKDDALAVSASMFQVHENPKDHF